MFFILLFNLYFFLDHFQPSEEILAEGLPADEELAEDQDLDDMYTLEELFKELESGDPVKAGKLILQKKKLFVPMRKHFQVCILILFIGFWTQNNDLQVNNPETVVNFFHNSHNLAWSSAIYQNLLRLFNLWNDKKIHVICVKIA